MAKTEYRGMLADHGLGQVPLSIYDHHRSHAATAYYGLRSDPKKKYLVLTCDGSGDNLCATVRVMGGGDEELIAVTPDERHAWAPSMPGSPSPWASCRWSTSTS